MAPIRTLLVILWLLTGSSADAGIRFDFLIESTADQVTPVRSGSITIAESAWRVDYDEDNQGATAVFSTDGGLTETALNDEMQTYYEPKRIHYRNPSSRMLSMPFVPPGAPPVVTLKKLDVQEEQSPEVIEGMAARKWVVSLGYEVQVDVGSEVLKGIFSTTALIWTTDARADVPFPLDPRTIVTGWDTIDASLAELREQIPGFPLKRQMTVTRRIVGGRPFTDVITTTITAFQDAELSGTDLEIPSGYINQEPIIGAPGS
jgi:hypothetical protein